MITKRMIVQAILQTASRLDSCTDDEPTWTTAS